jgi:hypothetical protein
MLNMLEPKPQHTPAPNYNNRSFVMTAPLKNSAQWIVFSRRHILSSL